MGKKNKKKNKNQQVVITILYVMIGVLCGVLFMQHINVVVSPDAALNEELFALLILLFALYTVFFLQIILHEAGHLIFGLLSGYRFLSFRIGNIILLKRNGHLKLKRYSLAGTGGQCLMIPPEMKDGKIPYILYNLGGALMNLVSSLWFLILNWIYKDVPYLSVSLLMGSIIGFGFAITNAIPIRTKMIDNDGCNLLSISRNPEAMRSFWIQLNIIEQISANIRLKDMPAEWFRISFTDLADDSLSIGAYICACSRLMDLHCFQEADRMLAQLLEGDSRINGIQRHMIICDMIYCELINPAIGGKERDWMDKAQMKFMQVMKNNPAILRTEYTYALLAEHNKLKADSIRMRFEKSAKKYSYPIEIESERELMKIADDLLSSRSII